MRRRLLNLASVMSLLLCAAIVALWVRSFWISDGFVGAYHGNVSFGRSVYGHLSVIRVYGLARADAREFKLFRWKYLVDDPQRFFTSPGAFSGGHSGTDKPNFDFLGVAVLGGRETYFFGNNPKTVIEREYVSRLIVIPFCIPCLILAWPLFVVAARQLKRIRWRYPAGACRRCGYDLRASTDRCPECGTPIHSGKSTGRVGDHGH